MTALCNPWKLTVVGAGFGSMVGAGMGTAVGAGTGTVVGVGTGTVVGVGVGVGGQAPSFPRVVIVIGSLSAVT